MQEGLTVVNHAIIVPDRTSEPEVYRQFVDNLEQHQIAATIHDHQFGSVSYRSFGDERDSLGDACNQIAGCVAIIGAGVGSELAFDAAARNHLIKTIVTVSSLLRSQIDVPSLTVPYGERRQRRYREIIDRGVKVLTIFPESGDEGVPAHCATIEGAQQSVYKGEVCDHADGIRKILRDKGMIQTIVNFCRS